MENISQYKYYVEMSYLDVDTNKATDIMIELIKTITIDYDYDNKICQ